MNYSSKILKGNIILLLLILLNTFSFSMLPKIVWLSTYFSILNTCMHLIKKEIKNILCFKGFHKYKFAIENHEFLLN